MSRDIIDSIAVSSTKKTSEQFRSDVGQHGPADAWHDLVYYLIDHYSLSSVLRHIQWIDAAANDIISEYFGDADTAVTDLGLGE